MPITFPPVPGGLGGGSALEVFDEGVSLDDAVESLDFVGAGVTATVIGNAITVTIPGGGSTDPVILDPDILANRPASGDAPASLFYATDVDLAYVSDEAGAGWTTLVFAAGTISLADSGALYTATDVEAALAEVITAHNTHLADTADAHDASAISILDTATNFDATNVEDALIELRTLPEGTWLDDTDTWVYVSASSFQVTGKDVRSRFPAGTRVSYNDGAVDYGYVYWDAEMSGSDTLVNLIPNDDYAIANTALTAPRYSYDLKVPGHPYWLGYTATFSGWSANPGMSLYAAMEGDTLILYTNPTSTGTSNNVSHTVTFPAGGESHNTHGFYQFVSRGIDNGTGQPGLAFINVNTNVVGCAGILGSLSNTASGTSRPGPFIMRIQVVKA